MLVSSASAGRLGSRSSSNAVLLIVNVRLFATVTVTAVLFAASATAGDVAESMVAGAEVCVVTTAV